MEYIRILYFDTKQEAKTHIASLKHLGWHFDMKDNTEVIEYGTETAIQIYNEDVTPKQKVVNFEPKPKWYIIAKK